MPTPSSKAPQPKHLARALGLVSAAALLLASAPAGAQVDVFPPLKNVMLLVDTSGSMEFQFSGADVTCNADNEGATNDRSRWVHLVEALTGSIQNYSCEAIDRSDNMFATGGEYALGGIASYDYKHPIPFHRALSNGCAVRPGTLPNSANVFQYPDTPVNYKHYNSDADCTFEQNSDGVIDAFASEVRLGLMTFDSLTDAGTGVSGTAASLATGVAGTWSYYPGYLSTNTGKATGAARECLATDQEVGARNGGAPPWEGRMVNFGDPARGALANLTKAQQIQEILLSTRPFGATPIAGMLQDAETFFFEDDSVDQDGEPTSPSDLKYSPKDDPYVDQGCRDQIIILITDGHPNLDLRPDCEGDSSCDPADPDCKCPYDEAEDIALRLARSTTRNRVPILVVGMALEEFDYNGDTVSCSTLKTDGDLDAACADATNAANRALQACCSLQRIAEAGDDPDDELEAGDAIFVDSPDELRSTLSALLSLGLPDSSRTQPVFSGGGASALSTHRFYSSYIPKQLRPWEGRIERERYQCEDDDSNPATPKRPLALPIDEFKGDDFAANLNSGIGPARRFYTVIGDDPVDSRATIRPHIGTGPSPDGISVYNGTIVTGTDDVSGSIFSAEVPPAAMELPNGSCTLSDTACRDRYLKWLIGVPNGTTDTRCIARGDKDCGLLGDVFHSTPRAVNRPLAALRDESYTKFASINATRPAVLYTSTNDGFLHAFKTLSNANIDPSDTVEHVMTQTNNELWAFIPPAILPDLDSLYPFSHQLLLDGAPVVKDVVAVVNEDDPDEIFFVRTQDAAKQGNSSWRTVLVQSFGSVRGGYFAVDITQPVPDENSPVTVTQGGPRFLWQLTRDGSGDPLFGDGGSTPLITTVFIAGAEVAVAVLPGGVGDVGNDGDGSGCSADLPADVAIETAFPPRDRVKCYPAAKTAAHSLTIVRLDTGEVLRTFRRTVEEMHSLIQDAGVIGTAPLASPITGQPVAYPAEVGAVADRIFVGDADGRLWKVDVSSDVPSQWTMDLFFDAYPEDVNGVGSHDFDDGQPIQTPPVLSVDDLGKLTVAVSTGDQDTAGTATDMTNYVWSLTEDVVDNDFETHVNWYQPLEDGERVTGPMSLFSSTLYFSTFSPPANGDSVCNSGSSRLWGVDYLLPNEDTNLGSGGKAVALKVLPTDPQFVQYLAFENLVVGGDAGVKPVVFGVTIAQLPTCFDDATGADEDWLGYGTHEAMNQINPGKFELVVHTGQAGTSIPGGTTNVFKMELPTPPAMTSIDSWAAIVE